MLLGSVQARRLPTMRFYPCDLPSGVVVHAPRRLGTREARHQGAPPQYDRVKITRPRITQTSNTRPHYNPPKADPRNTPTEHEKRSRQNSA